jgi:hypothetical protein
MKKRSSPKAPAVPGDAGEPDYQRASEELGVLCAVYEDMITKRTQELAAAQAQVRLLRHALQAAQIEAARLAGDIEAARAEAAP